MYRSVRVVEKLNLPKFQTLRFLNGTPKPYFEAANPKAIHLEGKYKHFAPIIEHLQSESTDHLKEQTVWKTCNFQESKIDDNQSGSDFGSNAKIHFNDNIADDNYLQESVKEIQYLLPMSILVGGILIGTSVLINILHTSTMI